MVTHGQRDPYVQLCVFLLQDADHFISFWQLIKVKLNNLQDTIYSNLCETMCQQVDTGTKKCALERTELTGDEL